MNRRVSTSPLLLIASVALVLSAPLGAWSQSGDWPELAGPYLGQTPPGDEPELFAPGLVCTAWGDRDLMISPDGTEIWFGMLDRLAVTIRVSRLENGIWTEPIIPAFAADRAHPCLEPAMTADGQRIYFLSTLPLPEEEDRPGWGNQNIFFVERQANGWSEPRPAPAPISTENNEYYPSLCTDGTLYYTYHLRGEPARIWRSRLVDGAYGEPKVLPDQVNRGGDCYNAFIAPDESYIIVCIGGIEENLGAADYWISFRNERDEWSEAVNLGPLINGPETRAGSAYVSPDGKYLFFSATWSDAAEFFPENQLTVSGLQRVHESPGNGSSDIYWLSAAFLDGLKPAGW
jgi:hypothetical protein